MSPLWAIWTQATSSHPIFLRYVLILSSHIDLGIPSDFLSSDFSTKTLCAFRLSSIRAICSFSLLLLFGFITLIIFDEKYKWWISSSCCVSHEPPNIPRLRLRYLSQHLILHHRLSSFISVGGKFHTKNRPNYRFVYSDVMYVDNRREDKRFWTKCWQTFLEFNLLLIFSCLQFWALLK